jgi:hypothetical protein
VVRSWYSFADRSRLIPATVTSREGRFNGQLAVADHLAVAAARDAPEHRADPGEQLPAQRHLRSIPKCTSFLR